jgi:beta-N-acetylhexosaminidase
MTAALVSGLQQRGVAATLKHFPGKGEAAVDPHYELPVLALDRERLDRVEFPPFAAGIKAGARLMMVGHYGLPALIGDRTTPASVAPAVLSDLIRRDLGFEGLVVTDALDMGGFGDFSLDLPLRAGADLLLYGPAQAGSLPAEGTASSGRVADLLSWLGTFPQPSLDVVGCKEHQELAAELAMRAITLVSNEQGVVPLRLSSDDKILTVMTQPTDLTPADTSSLVAPGLGTAVRKYHAATSEVVTSVRPSAGEIAEVVAKASQHEVTIIGTIDATVEQANLVTALLDTGRPIVTVALRTPYDLARYPSASTHLCTYGIHPPSMNALAAALFGQRSVGGRLPVGIPGSFPAGHGIKREAS